MVHGNISAAASFLSERELRPTIHLLDCQRCGHLEMVDTGVIVS